ncbi:PREDICTED: DENN domain-containing protein 1A-like isoform X2 [Nicrophorus vespilloides]|uniref:DENN domain-containing protein 1A-like isoform X2 n=2 Tax=Nicrophorus vespilloides TaxID=110193 RepID=A0ABM1MSF4_NICVS|nr:PREDICTED: DENN domain-containing protein 1A-like isoform X2 [Nicrophorus vespilloides]
MFSRLRVNVSHFFECFCEIVPPSSDKDAWIIQQFPENYKDEEVLKSVPKFAYPYTFENNVIQHYSFVLTDIESKWTFGFCRHDPKSQTALVVLSHLPWHQALYKFLDSISVLMHSPRANDLRDFLQAVYGQRIADPGKNFIVHFNNGESIFNVECPKQFQLPSIPENRNLTEYYNAIDTNNMIIIFASMLYERRIIFTSKKLTRLSACVQSANDVIYPMIWQHIFIPVLPMALMDYLLAPMPFLIGVPDEVLKKVNRCEIGDVVILDADTNKIETPFDDLNNLPTDVVTSLKKQLKNKSSLLGDGVSRAFLRALVQLIGGYRDALQFQPGEKVTFGADRFIETRPLSSQPFLREMLNLQIFQQFIEERLDMLNNGLGFSDEFEIEACRYSDKSSSKLKQQYKEWTSSMKKEGSAFFKSVKDKANPAMKSAVKTVKDGGKGMRSAYKELKMKLKDNQSPQQLRNGLEGLDKPRSAPNSPTGKRRSMGFGNPVASYRKEPQITKKMAFESPLSSQPMSPDRSRSGSPPLMIPQIDLMNEMQDLLQLRLDTPPVDRSLKPVRSLENFKHSSPTSSPDRWIFPSRTGAPMASPQSHLFKSRAPDTQNLLQSPDDVFSSPPVPPRTHDLFGTAPFVVGGGRENGQPVFLIANQHTIDVVRLSPPSNSPSKKKSDESQDLIRLDSSSDIYEFDPLKSNSSLSSSSYLNSSDLLSKSLEDGHAPLSVSNPLYNYENHNIKQNGTPTERPKYNSKDKDLLEEYGIDFNMFDSFGNTTQKANPQGEWATFE